VKNPKTTGPSVAKPSKKPRAPSLITDPIAYWKAQHAQAKADAKMARDKAPSVLPKLVSLERDAWRSYQAAVAAAEKPASTESAVADASLEGQLANAARIRKASEADGSWVAAKDMFKVEGEIALAIRQRDDLAAAREMSNLTEGAKFAMLVERLAKLPGPLKARVIAALGEP
jgi:hypothetical protein